MKKVISLIAILQLAVCASFAQGLQHMKFMGIPLDGTINQFQAKLSAKGISVDAEVNKTLDVGCRAFKGSFSGKSASIFVYYDESTKVVYRAKAVIESRDDDICLNNYDYYVNMLSSKYADAEVERDTQDGHPSITFYVLNNNPAIYKYLGTISVFRSHYLSTFFYVHVDYTDTINKVRHEERNMEDL